MVEVAIYHAWVRQLQPVLINRIVQGSRVLFRMRERGSTEGSQRLHPLTIQKKRGQGTDLTKKLR
jgi:acyl dehydratase